ncbi:MAG TPA: hypothetical protein VHC19_02045 [Pirellulales bacterium]|nr:hypothetical protein [Pirellulales bacterium]
MAEETPRPKKRVGARRKPLKQRKTVKDHLYPVNLFVSAEDQRKLDAIDEEFCCDSLSRAARISLKRWHACVSQQAQHAGFKPPVRPEFAVALSAASGGTLKKVYFTKDDMRRLDQLVKLTGCEVAGQLIRAAVGWQYEHLEV